MVNFWVSKSLGYDELAEIDKKLCHLINMYLYIVCQSESWCLAVLMYMHSLHFFRYCERKENLKRFKKQI